MRWIVLFFCVAALATACTAAGDGTQPKGAQVTATPVQAPTAQASLATTEATLEAVTAVLMGTSSVREAGEELASVLGVEPDRIRVRVQDARCSVCNAQQRPALTSLDGLSLEQAAPVIQPSMTFWLFVDDVICEYTLMGVTYTPHVCRRSPL